MSRGDGKQRATQTRNEKQKCRGERGLAAPKRPGSVPGPEPMPLGGVVSGRCTEQGTGDRREVTEEAGRAPQSKRCVFECSSQQGRPARPSTRGRSQTTCEASPWALPCERVTYSASHTVTLRRGTPNQAAEAACGTGPPCSRGAWCSGCVIAGCGPGRELEGRTGPQREESRCPCFCSPFRSARLDVALAAHTRGPNAVAPTT